jgi:triosephosphate isomerase
MLADVGCRYAIVGHSERRAIYGESDEPWRASSWAGKHARADPVRRRSLEERERDATRWSSCASSTRRCGGGGGGLCAAVVAYEPVCDRHWPDGDAGPGPGGSRDDPRRIAEKMLPLALPRVLYGGSVKAANAAERSRCPMWTAD